MKKTTLFFLFLFSLTNAFAQKIDNNLLGKFTSPDNKQLYSNFEFDNNGKVTIADFSRGDFFIKNDTLIVFPDKDVFKFIIEKDKIRGVSNWVKDGVWLKNKDISADNRKNDELAKNNASLLNEYYEKTRLKNNQMDMLFDEKLLNEYQQNIENLCNKNLVRACKEWFGMETMNQSGGMEALLSGKKTDVKDGQKLLDIANKVLTIDPAEGHHLLGLYYVMTKQTQKGDAELDKAVEMGSKDAGLAKLNLDIAKEENAIYSNTSSEGSVNPDASITVSDLRYWNEISFDQFSEDIKKNKGYRYYDKEVSGQFEVRDFENNEFEKLSKFVYKNASENRIEFYTKDLSKINLIREELNGLMYNKSIKNSESGEMYEDYKKEENIGGTNYFYFVGIIYPSAKKPNEPFIVILYK